jgi:hypothetical protein
MRFDPSGFNDAARGGLRAAPGRGRGGDVDRGWSGASGAGNGSGFQNPQMGAGQYTWQPEEGSARSLSPKVVQWLSTHNPQALYRFGYRPVPITPPRATPAAPPAPPQVTMPSMFLSDGTSSLPTYGVQSPAYGKPSGYGRAPRAPMPVVPYR